jgi:ABC-type dipeptide/oligopeptide/nickel transport system permease component
MRRRSALVVLIQRLGSILVTLTIIALLTSFGLAMAERGRMGLPAEPLSTIGETLRWTVNYVVAHPSTYFWSKQTLPAAQLVLTILGRSAGLLSLSLVVAAAIGVPLGIAAALARRRFSAPLVLVISVLGMSTPTFFLGMLLWILNIQLYQRLGVTALPAAGFGWDAHMIMPALVLAARPLAQVAQITYVTLSEQLGQDYVRTARAKGLAAHDVNYRHALRNVLIPILTTLGTSLRFSLSSLPVVEFFFSWPGVGLTLLTAISQGEPALVTDLILSLGLFFLLVNGFLELLYPLLDPRLRSEAGRAASEERLPWKQQLAGLRETLADWAEDLRRLLPGRQQMEKLPPLPAGLRSSHAGSPEKKRPHPGRWVARNILSNPAFLAGTVLVIAFAGLALFGGKLATANPYETHSIMSIQGTIAAPPFKPSPVFPWGSDHIGRDVQALVLWGGQQTLTLAFFAMLARVLLGTVLGLLAGWWHDRWFDRLVNGAIGVWAAFPATLFAMLLIQALGIQQGVSVFIVALCVVGWTEVAQFVRAQVIALKPQLFIEAARSMGARPGRILARHVLPHLIAPLLVLAALEMGGILLLLAELGFLNVFLGGGFRVEIMEGALHFSDVPEWGAQLANIRQWWRSYPWLAWYPGLAFFLAIVSFNLFGEGLRRLIESSRINLSRLVNGYTLAALIVIVFGLGWALRSTAPLSLYQDAARQFDAQRALTDIQALAAPEMGGRETGTAGAQQAADYIAGRMKEIGLFPAGEKGTYVQTMSNPRFHLTEVPRLDILDSQGNVAESLSYRTDFVEYTLQVGTMGQGEGAIVGLALGPDPGTTGDPYALGNRDFYDKIILLRETDLGRLSLRSTAGVLLVSANPGILARKYLFQREGYASSDTWRPVMVISPATADRLLATAGSSLADLDRQAAALGAGEVAETRPGATVRLAVIGDIPKGEVYYDVIGVIPGTGAEMGPRRGQGLDSYVIVVSAYYDGLGIGPDGTLYPGANDNASGVAAMLELARALKASPFQPKKTVLFVAWAGGERGEELSISNVMNAKRGFSELTVEAVIELSGVGAGSGSGLALGPGSSFRLVQLWQDAAGRMGVAATTRGRDPHYGLPAQRSFGGRSALTIALSWDGSDQEAHTAADTVEKIDLQKLEKAGRTTLLGLYVLSREVDY